MVGRAYSAERSRFFLGNGVATVCLSRLVLVEAPELPGVETQAGDPGIGSKGRYESSGVETGKGSPLKAEIPSGLGWMSLACGHRPTIPRPIVDGDCWGSMTGTSNGQRSIPMRFGPGISGVKYSAASVGPLKRSDAPGHGDVAKSVQQNSSRAWGVSDSAKRHVRT